MAAAAAEVATEVDEVIRVEVEAAGVDEATVRRVVEGAATVVEVALLTTTEVVETLLVEVVLLLVEVEVEVEVGVAVVDVDLLVHHPNAQSSATEETAVEVATSELVEVTSTPAVTH